MKTSLKTALIMVAALLTLALSAAGIALAQADGILFAAPLASGSGDCSSWANTCTLQTALSYVVSGNEIWVAAGTHKPVDGTDISAGQQYNRASGRFSSGAQILKSPACQTVNHIFKKM